MLTADVARLDAEAGGYLALRELGDTGFTARTYTHIYRDAENRRGVAMADAIRRARDSLTTATAGCSMSP